MNKQFFAVIIIVVASLFGVLALTKDKATAPVANNGSSEQISNHKIGAGKRGVTLVEYGDFQCPVCKQYFPILQQIKSDLGDDITFVFRHYPLPQLHPNAMIAARAAEAAGLQGKFFEFHDLLYENQDSWAASQNPAGFFEGFAAQLGLDLAKFKNDMKSESVANIINADVASAQALGSSSTPTFLINGKRVEQNPRTVEAFEKLLKDAYTR